jgi:outer membrane protein assembly factor BamB
MSIPKDVLYIGIGRHVVAIQMSTGQELWRTKLKMSASYTTITVRPEGIFAGANGHLFCLDPATGAIRLRNALDGLGHSIISFGEPSTVTAMASAAAAAAVAASSA